MSTSSLVPFISFRRLALLGAVAVSLACGKAEEEQKAEPTLPPQGLEEGCNPLLGGADCFLPYPSDFFRVADATLPSGFRIEHTGAGKLKGKGSGGRKISADVTEFGAFDGFSRVNPIVTFFGAATSPIGFVAIADDPTKSLAAATSNTLIVDAETGKAVAHYVDLDPRTTDLKRQSITIHTHEVMQEKHRYVVAVHGVKGTDGSVLPAPEGFRRLREKVAKGDPVLEPLAARYEKDVFPVLEKAGLTRAELQQAWDFTVGTDLHVHRDMDRVRELTLAWLATHPVDVKIDSVTNGSSGTTSGIWFTAEGTFEAPLFLTEDKPAAGLFRGADGQVAQNGTTRIPLTVMVPNTLKARFEPGFALQYGHGFFGQREEVTYGGTVGVANATGSVLFGLDWQGMSTADVGNVGLDMASKPHQTMRFAERLHQGMANWIVLSAALNSTMKAVPELHRPTAGTGVVTQGGVSNAGALLFSGGAENYLGISQGQILGGTMLAVNPYPRRVLFNVGGAGFTHMMFRASPFGQFLTFLEIPFPDALDQQKYVATLQRAFDRFDPASYAHRVLAPLPAGFGTLDRRVLMQIGLGDDVVPNLGSWLHARGMGLSQFTPNAAAIWGLPQQAFPKEGSGLVVWDFGYDLSTAYSVAKPPDNERPVHERMRQPASVTNQMKLFLESGSITDTCAGIPCAATR